MKFIFKHYRKQQLIHEEVVCDQHRDEMSDEGGFMAPPTEAEKKAGIRMTFTPYDGRGECACCTEEAEKAQSAEGIAYENKLSQAGGKY